MGLRATDHLVFTSSQVNLAKFVTELMAPGLVRVELNWFNSHDKEPHSWSVGVYCTYPWVYFSADWRVILCWFPRLSLQTRTLSGSWTERETSLKFQYILHIIFITETRGLRIACFCWSSTWKGIWILAEITQFYPKNVKCNIFT